MRASDVLVASFPRSGSTRLRLILAGLVTPDAAAIQSHDVFEGTVPELGGPARWDRQLDWPLFIKTHRPYSPLLARPRAILLLRHPLDALASFHAYRSALIGVPTQPSGAFLRDARVGLPRWIRHTRSWAARARHTMRFKALSSHPQSEIVAMMEALGLSPQLARLDDAIARATPDVAHRLRATRKGGDRLGPSFDFARSDHHQPRATFSAADAAWATRQLDQAGLMPLVETL